MRLHPNHVPPPPESTKWIDILRWMVFVMSEENRDFRFTVSLLKHCVEHDGTLTHKQAKFAERIWNKMLDGWAADELQCQQIAEEEESESEVSSVSVHGPWMDSLSLDDKDRAILEILAEKMDGEGAARIHVGALANKTKLNPVGLRVRTRSLESRGILTVERKRGQMNVYRFGMQEATR